MALHCWISGRRARSRGPVPAEEGPSDNLKQFEEAGLTMPLIWPPFSGVTSSKTLDDLKVLANDIMPKVNAI